MKDKYQNILDMPETPANVRYYLGYQYRLGKEFIAPYLLQAGVFKQGSSAAEIGSAEGGVLAALKYAGAGKALATDIHRERLAYGKDIADRAGVDIDFQYHNILDDEIPADWIDYFDVVILRDVIEHLEGTSEALGRIRKIIKPGGCLYLTFPSYYSAFGGHQHTVANILGKLPFVHLLPDPLFYAFLKGGRENDIWEVKRLQKIKLTPKKLISAAHAEGYEIYSEDHYLLRPVFKMKFGLPSLKLGFLKNIPYATTFLSLEASFILRKNVDNEN